MIGILLVAGRGTRMKSERPKVLFDVNDEPMCFAPLRALMDTCDRVVAVIGYKGPEVERALMSRAIEVYGEKAATAKIKFALQDPPQGTGDAVRQAVKVLGKALSPAEEVIILNGDLPLIRKETLTRMLKQARELKMTSACLSMRVARPTGLGRILRDERGVFTGIREEKDARPDEKAIREVNGGVYYFSAPILTEALQTLKSDNKQGEFYLTDLLGNRADRTRRSEALLLRSPWDLMGVNTTYELSTVRKLAQSRLQKKICEELGVDLLDPAVTYISARTEFKGSCRIGPGTVINGKCTIGVGVEIDGQCLIQDTQIDDRAHIRWGSVLSESTVGPAAQVGPMAHLRPGSELGPQVKIGNFVEIKKTKMAKGAKASHLSYLGDATIGADVNIGCGTITCNYDGFNKHATVIGDGAFIGSDTQLVAPVTVGAGAFVASGTTVTKNVPEGALALSRTPLIIKEGYAKRLTGKFRSQKAKK